MLRPGGHPAGIQKWYDRLAAVVDQVKERLQRKPVAQLARRSGCSLDTTGTLHLTYFWQEYRIGTPDLVVRHADTGQEATSFIQALLLSYLDKADNTPPSGQWIAYRDLPDGMFYANAFRGYAENELVRTLGDDGLEAFRRAAAPLSSWQLDLGSAGYAFQVLPRVHLAAVYWQGDEDFGSQASILFEDTSPHYLSTDGLAVLGTHLVNAITRTAHP